MNSTDRQYEVCVFNTKDIVTPQPLSYDEARQHATCLAERRLSVKLDQQEWSVFFAEGGTSGEFQVGLMRLGSTSAESRLRSQNNVEICHVMRPWTGEFKRSNVSLVSRGGW